MLLCTLEASLLMPCADTSPYFRTLKGWSASGEFAALSALSQILTCESDMPRAPVLPLSPAVVLPDVCVGRAWGGEVGEGGMARWESWLARLFVVPLA